MLAELASFFGVTLDELVGYEPQLGREQIRRIYRELAEDFAKKPFAEVMAVCRRYIRRYGSCWPFLLQMAGLLLNHAPLAPRRRSGGTHSMKRSRSAAGCGSAAATPALRPTHRIRRPRRR